MSVAFSAGSVAAAAVVVAAAAAAAVAAAATAAVAAAVPAAVPTTAVLATPSASVTTSASLHHLRIPSPSFLQGGWKGGKSLGGRWRPRARPFGSLGRPSEAAAEQQQMQRARRPRPWNGGAERD